MTLLSQDRKIHVVLLGNAPHIIRLPTVWGTNNINLTRKIQLHESHLFGILKALNDSFTKRKNPGKIIYHLDTMPVYSKFSGSLLLTRGVMHPFSYDQQ